MLSKNDERRSQIMMMRMCCKRRVSEVRVCCNSGMISSHACAQTWAATVPNTTENYDKTAGRMHGWETVPPLVERSAI
jgi:hypothetical protein